MPKRGYANTYHTQYKLIMGLIVAGSCTLNESECFSDFWSCPIMLSEQNRKVVKFLNILY